MRDARPHRGVAARADVRVQAADASADGAPPAPSPARGARARCRSSTPARRCWCGSSSRCRGPGSRGCVTSRPGSSAPKRSSWCSEQQLKRTPRSTSSRRRRDGACAVSWICSGAEAGAERALDLVVARRVDVEAELAEERQDGALRVRLHRVAEREAVQAREREGRARRGLERARGRRRSMGVPKRSRTSAASAGVRNMARRESSGGRANATARRRACPRSSRVHGCRRHAARVRIATAMPTLRFAKLHGTANDFVYVDARGGLPRRSRRARAPPLRPPSRHRRRRADPAAAVRHATPTAAWSIYNADGSRAEMCGNGIRGFAKFVLDRGLVRARAAAGRDRRRREDARGRARRRPRAPRRPSTWGRPSGTAGASRSTPTARSSSGRSRWPGATWRVTCVSMGNPHCVVFVDDVAAPRRCRTLGPHFEHHPFFPKPREHGVHPRREPRAARDAGVGARRGRDHGVRHRRLRRRRRRRPHRPERPRT